MRAPKTFVARSDCSKLRGIIPHKEIATVANFGELSRTKKLTSHRSTVGQKHARKINLLSLWVM